MCWKTNKQSVRLQIADKEIPVFKVVDENLVSIYEGFQYTIGKTYHTHSLRLDNNKIQFGFHSYTSNVTLRPGDDLLVIEFKDILLDYHFIRRLNIAVLECMIPIGAQYCINEKGEVVSNQIKVLNAKPGPSVKYSTFNNF